MEKHEKTKEQLAVDSFGARCAVDVVVFGKLFADGNATYIASGGDPGQIHHAASLAFAFAAEPTIKILTDDTVIRAIRHAGHLAIVRFPRKSKVRQVKRRDVVRLLNRLSKITHFPDQTTTVAENAITGRGHGRGTPSVVDEVAKLTGGAS